MFGPYYLHESLNHGGMAEIWHVTDGDGQAFALRLLHSSFRFNFTARRRFKRGCEIMTALQPHPFIVRSIEHGKIKGRPYALMEYLECSNLKELYSRQDDLLSEFLGNILIDSAIALQYMHDKGYMHLDFKPENVLVTRNGNVRLIDFDLSLPIENKPIKLSSVPGTPAYMAPEQLGRKPFDHRADMFSFGVSAYEMLTYRKPWDGENAGEVLRMMTSGTGIISPREINPDVPAALEKIILKCLEIDPANRYHDMSFLVRDLETVLYVK